jgi:hypothetical protein
MAPPAQTRRRYRGAPIPNTFPLEVQRGVVTGVSSVRKFGHNPSVVTGSYQDIWDGGGAYPFQTSASAVRIQAGGDAGDTAAGAGAQKIAVEGLDENWALATEDIATAGAAQSLPTTTTFTRVFRAYVKESGTYGGTNIADIDIETTGATVVAVIPADVGQTQMALYTIPDGKVGYLCGIDFSGTSTQTYDVRVFKREKADDIAAPFGPVRIVSEFNGQVRAGDREFCVYPSALPARTDIWMSAVANGGAGVALSGEFDLWLVDVA